MDSAISLVIIGKTERILLIFEEGSQARDAVARA
jgi:hypothetical protein